MTDISASAVSSLRARTGVSILACKQALEEAGGDEEKAIEILRKRGIAQAAKKAERDQKEGKVFLKDDGSKAAVAVLRCETDFVARDENFDKAGKAIVEALFTSGVDDAKKLADETLPELVQKLGENITATDMTVTKAEVIGTYLHSNAKIGVVVGLAGGDKEMARDVAMHAAAMNPQFVRPEDVPSEHVAKEKEIWIDQLKKEGKPEAMMEKIMGGKEKKFREENALLKQPFVKDQAKSVEQHLGSASVTEYVRVSVA